ncbi:MAG: hypothetical protein JO244_03605 [Solirubrobacterales bacterium]|nr:hypothetical protein [Solirubrobacterales bacterium]
MTARSLTRGELISAGSALLLLVLLFAVAWYGVDGIPGRPGSHGGAAGSETGWQGLTGFRWLILLTVLLTFVVVVIHAAGPARQTVAGLRLGLLVLGWVTAGVLIVRVLIALPTPDRVVDQKLGALCGMLAALGIACGASEAVREQRSRLAATGVPGAQAGDAGAGDLEG